MNHFDEWLGCARLLWTQRPVPLTEGVLDRTGVYQAVDSTGRETETQLLPRHAIRQRKKDPSAQDVIVPLAQLLVSRGEKLLIFRNRRGPAEGCALYLARELGLPAVRDAIAALPSHDPSSSAPILRECLSGGTAFHNANLKREERISVERNFRNPKGGIEALAATTTLAAGINTPASTVILAEQEFVGEDGRPFNVAEYKNMAGRAGRLGFNETGKAIILAENPMQRGQLFKKYVRGSPEPIRSSFAEHDPRTWVIRLLSQVKAVQEAEVPHLIASTFGGFLAQRDDPKWRAATEQRIADIVTEFVRLGLLDRLDSKVQLTLLGRACGQSTLAFDSAMRLIETVKAIPSTELSAFQLVAVLQVLPEADRTYTPIGLRKSRKESARINDAAKFFGDTIIQALRRWVSDEHGFWARCKRAAILADWMSGTPIRDIEERYSVPFGGDVRLGDIQRFADAARFHFRSAHQILSALFTMTPEKEEEFQRVAKQLEFGVPADLAELMEMPIALSRGECLVFANRGTRSRAALLALPPETLHAVLGDQRAKEITRVLARLREA